MVGALEELLATKVGNGGAAGEEVPAASRLPAPLAEVLQGLRAAASGVVIVVGDAVADAARLRPVESDPDREAGPPETGGFLSILGDGARRVGTRLAAEVTQILDRVLGSTVSPSDDENIKGEA
jgi:hypothetical protein